VYNVVCDPSDMLIIQMTEEKAREHSKKRLARTFRVSPEVLRHWSGLAKLNGARLRSAFTPFMETVTALSELSNT